MVDINEMDMKGRKEASCADDLPIDKQTNSRATTCPSPNGSTAVYDIVQSE